MFGKNQFRGYQSKVPRLLGALQKSGVMSRIVRTESQVHIGRERRVVNSCIDLETGKLWLSSDVPYSGPRHHAMHRVFATFARTAIATASANRVRSILATGDGTFERPFVVRSILDEYLVLSQTIVEASIRVGSSAVAPIRKLPRLQGLMSDTIPPMDCVSSDATLIHFDISAFWNHGTLESELSMCKNIASRWKAIGSGRDNPRKYFEDLFERRPGTTE